MTLCMAVFVYILLSHMVTFNPFITDITLKPIEEWLIKLQLYSLGDYLITTN